MSIKRTCAYILMAGGILFFGDSITQAGGSQSGSTMEVNQEPDRARAQVPSDRPGREHPAQGL